jgi:hypothetical protein
VLAIARASAVDSAIAIAFVATLGSAFACALNSFRGIDGAIYNALNILFAIALIVLLILVFLVLLLAFLLLLLLVLSVCSCHWFW